MSYPRKISHFNSLKSFVQKFSFSGERCHTYPNFREEFHRKLEFNTSAVNILNNLEHMGYKVVTSGAFVASQNSNNKVFSQNSILPGQISWGFSG